MFNISRPLSLLPSSEVPGSSASRQCSSQPFDLLVHSHFALAAPSMLLFLPFNSPSGFPGIIKPSRHLLPTPPSSTSTTTIPLAHRSFQYRFDALQAPQYMLLTVRRLLTLFITSVITGLESISFTSTNPILSSRSQNFRSHALLCHLTGLPFNHADVQLLFRFFADLLPDVSTFKPNQALLADPAAPSNVFVLFAFLCRLTRLAFNHEHLFQSSSPPHGSFNFNLKPYPDFAQLLSFPYYSTSSRTHCPAFKRANAKLFCFIFGSIDQRLKAYLGAAGFVSTQDALNLTWLTLAWNAEGIFKLPELFDSKTKVLFNHLITVFVSTLNSSKLSYVPPYSNSTNPFMINLNPTRRQHQHRLNPTHVALLSALRSLKISFELQVQLNSEAHLSPEVPGLAVDLRVAAVVNATLRHRTFNAAIDFDSPQAVKRMHSKFVEYRFVAT
ncbi:hypothetical protein DFH06DRAFT_1342892 [Mycena polygramma]|nr:hypothetical protein DFH06DRAFT_1342892 [Mycena polygramma]